MEFDGNCCATASRKAHTNSSSNLSNAWSGVCALSGQTEQSLPLPQSAPMISRRIRVPVQTPTMAGAGILELWRASPDVFGKNLIANGEADDLEVLAINPVVFRPRPVDEQ